MIPKTTRISLAQKIPVEILPESYISLALDASQIIGGYWWDASDKISGGLGAGKVPPMDLSNEKLRFMTSLLKPGCLRMGGTEADRFYYSFEKGKTHRTIPEGYHYILTARRWKELEEFCRTVGTRLMVTLNAGPGPGIEKKRWRRKNARHFIKYTQAECHDIQVWEFGNEINAHAFFMGIGNGLKPADYGRDLKRVKKTVGNKTEALIAGPALAVWPLLGETLPFLKRFLKKSGKDKTLDVITWHYYPQQSRRAPFAVRRARRETLLKPSCLDEAGRQARKIRKIRDLFAPEIPLWLGETGHALCGGEPGLSDSFYSGFWWLDQLALMAREGQKQVIRQTLTGGDYGLLDKENHAPLPDFWTTLLWNRYCGPEVYALVKPQNRKLRLYLHSLKNREGQKQVIRQTLTGGDYGLLDIRKSCPISWDSALPPLKETALLTSPDIYSRKIFLNGRELDEFLLPREPEAARSIQLTDKREVTLPPLSYGFILLYL